MGIIPPLPVDFAVATGKESGGMFVNVFSPSCIFPSEEPPAPGRIERSVFIS